MLCANITTIHFAKMDKCLRPQVFSTEADTADGARSWQHWKRTLENYLRRIDNISAQDKLDVLISLLDGLTLPLIATSVSVLHIRKLSIAWKTSTLSQSTKCMPGIN